MPDNFHDADCALRHSGKVCTCGYQKQLTGQEKELARLREELAEASCLLLGGTYIAQAFLEIKERSEEKDEPVPNVIEWQENAMKFVLDHPLPIVTHPTPELKHG
jgi:hypothetical protein